MHGVKGTEFDNCESMATLADAVEVTVNRRRTVSWKRLERLVRGGGGGGCCRRLGGR